MHHVDRNSAARRTTMTCSTKLCHIYFKVQVDVFSCLSSVIRLCCSYNETISDILCRRTSKARMSRFVASASLHVLHLHHWQEARRCKKGKKTEERYCHRICLCVSAPADYIIQIACSSFSGFL